MHPLVIDETLRVVDAHFPEQALNEFLKTSLHEKVQEQSKWSEFTICTHFMLDGNSCHIYKLAAYMELIMTALDIIDDLADQDNQHKIWMQAPHAIALNASIALLVAAIREISYLKELHSGFILPLPSEVSRWIALAANGQHQDLSNHPYDSEQAYLALIQSKSAPLIILACYMGYACAENCELSTQELLNEFARYLAIVQQIENDLHDLLRFDLKNDLLDKKRTFPILYLLSQDSERFPAFFHYYTGIISREQFLTQKQACIQAVIQSGCIEYCRVVQGLYTNRMLGILKRVPGNPLWKERFAELTLAPYLVLCE